MTINEFAMGEVLKLVNEIHITTNLSPNIIMHIFSCLEIEGSFYHSEYGSKHHFTLLDEEYADWEEIASKCVMLGCNAELFSVLFQIPSYIPTEDIDMVRDCFGAISEAINERTIQVLIDSYPGVFDNLPAYAPLPILDEQFVRLHEDREIILEVLQKFEELLKGVWDRFYQDYWENQAKKKFQKRIEELRLLVKPINLIDAWQKHLKIDFPYSEFVALLVEPTTTISTNLLAEKFVFPLDQEDLLFYKAIIHEIGRSFLLNSDMLENEHLQNIARSNIDRLSMIVDAACIHIKKDIYKKIRLRDDGIDPYAVPELKEIVDIFAPIWDSMEEKDLFEALALTYNKLSPVV